MVQQLVVDKDAHTETGRDSSQRKRRPENQSLVLFYCQHARADPTPLWASVFSSLQWEGILIVPLMSRFSVSEGKGKRAERGAEAECGWGEVMDSQHPLLTVWMVPESTFSSCSHCTRPWSTVRAAVKGKNQVDPGVLPPEAISHPH